MEIILLDENVSFIYNRFFIGIPNHDSNLFSCLFFLNFMKNIIILYYHYPSRHHGVYKIFWVVIELS